MIINQNRARTIAAASLESAIQVRARASQVEHVVSKRRRANQVQVRCLRKETSQPSWVRPWTLRQRFEQYGADQYAPVTAGNEGIDGSFVQPDKPLICSIIERNALLIIVNTRGIFYCFVALPG